jgi:hypothetical protein
MGEVCKLSYWSEYFESSVWWQIDYTLIVHILGQNWNEQNIIQFIVLHISEAFKCWFNLAARLQK